MIAVLQRVKRAAVRVEGNVVGECDNGLAVFLGVAKGDGEEDAAALCRKISKLRIFCDENDKMNLSVCDVGGGALVISNFTLLASYRHGNRPDYMNAEAPAEADRLYGEFCKMLSEALGKEVGRGRFGEHMEVEVINDGPITIVMDSKILLAGKKG